MSKIKAGIRSLRVRATPLVLSGMAMGISVASLEYGIHIPTAIFLVLTAVCLQFVSNLSNELGDSLSGTDGADREGMRYSIQSGELTQLDLKKMIGIFVALSCIFGLLMIWFAFGTFLSLEAVFFIVLGACAIVAAMRYTLGRNPYGYRGLGDIFVFIFFGLVATCGGYYMCTRDLAVWNALLPACAMGCFSVGVLNVNNIRDMKTDAATRVTMAIRMGEKGSRMYQTLLIVLGWTFMLAWVATAATSPRAFIFCVTLPLFVMHVAGVWKGSGHQLDKMVPLLSLSTFLLSILTFVR